MCSRRTDRFSPCNNACTADTPPPPVIPEGGDPSTTAAVTELPVGDDSCPNGGYEIEFGIDDDGDGLLDPEEVDGTAAICNGLDGAPGLPGDDGADGSPGTDGADGAPGVDGADGFNVVFAMSTEAPGANCAYGGQRLDMGLDDGTPSGTARDSVLQAGEIDQTRFVCSLGTGISEGTTATPVTLTVGEAYHGTVAAASNSYYRFTPTRAEVSLIGLALTDSDLSWTLYSDAFVTEVASCDHHTGYDADEWCTVPVLGAGQTYYLRVAEHSNIPNLMDVQAGGSMLLGADAYGRLYRVDTTYGDAAFLAATAQTGINSMAYEPRTARLFASLSTYDGTMVLLDPFVPSATDFPVTPPLGFGFGAFTGMSAHPTTGELYVMNESECSDGLAVDPLTGVSTLALVDSVPACYSLNEGGFPMAFDGADALYLVNNYGSADELYQIDVAADAGTSVGTFSFSGFPDPGNEGLVNSMAVRPEDGAAFVTTTAGHIGRMDWSTGGSPEVTYVGTPHVALDGLTFVGGGAPVYPPVYDMAAAGDSGGYSIATVSLSWRGYPAADSFTLYWGYAAAIDPANGETFTGTVSGVTGTAYDFVPVEQGATYGTLYFLLVPVVGGEEVPEGQSDEVFMPYLEILG